MKQNNSKKLQAVQFLKNQDKAIIFDAGILINFAMNGLLEEFRGLKRIFNGKFLITREVKEEIVALSLITKRFNQEALKI